MLVLKDPCHELADAKPAEIPKQLPRIINVIRVIWTNSEYYNTGDRLTAMFRKVTKNFTEFDTFFQLILPNQIAK